MNVLTAALDNRLVDRMILDLTEKDPTAIEADVDEGGGEAALVDVVALTDSANGNSTDIAAVIKRKFLVCLCTREIAFRVC